MRLRSQNSAQQLRKSNQQTRNWLRHSILTELHRLNGSRKELQTEVDEVRRNLDDALSSAQKKEEVLQDYKVTQDDLEDKMYAT